MFSGSECHNMLSINTTLIHQTIHNVTMKSSSHLHDVDVQVDPILCYHSILKKTVTSMDSKEGINWKPQQADSHQHSW